MMIIALILAGKNIIHTVFFILKGSECEGDTGLSNLDDCIEQEPEDETLDILDEDLENAC